MSLPSCSQSSLLSVYGSDFKDDTKECCDLEAPMVQGSQKGALQPSVAASATSYELGN